MIKAINGRYDDNAPNFAGVRQYAKSGGADSVIVWSLRWKFYEPQPGQYDESLWHDLDAQIYNAYVDGRRIFLAVSTESAPWVTAKQSGGLPTNPKANRPWRLPPDDISLGSPWCKYLERHLLRYPYLDGVIILNEPNAAFMDHANPGYVVADMLKTAVTLWASHKAKPKILAPATLDGPGCLRFSEEVLGGLGSGWKPPVGVHVVWAHHPYTDIKKGLTGISSQTWQLQKLLSKWKWHDGRWVWLTEGGYIFDVAGGPPPFPENYRYTRDQAMQEQDQQRNQMTYVRWCKQNGRIAMFAQYEYAASLWGGWDSGLRRHDGTIRPLHEEWRKL